MSGDKGEARGYNTKMKQGSVVLNDKQKFSNLT